MKFELVNIVNETPGTKSFFFRPEKSFNFRPGQYVYCTLPKLNYPDTKGATRHFTIASSPTEENIRLTTRIRQESGYKKTLNELTVGSVVNCDGPNGTFFFDEKEAGPHVFLAGGIGITPFRSIIKYIADNNLQNPIYLIYSNSDPDIVFKNEFDKISSEHQNIKIRYIVSSTEGHLDQSKIANFIENWKLKFGDCTLWLCGPPPFTQAMESALTNMKISSDKIRSEKFTGY